VDRNKDSPDSIDYAALNTTADVVVHVNYSEVDLHSTRSSTTYQPRMNVYGVVVVKGRGDYLFDGSIYYGVDAKEGKPWAILSDPTFAYPSFEALLSNVDDIRSRFERAATLVSERIATQMHEAIK
jgi:hypothetical protein